ncbi:MAG: S-layer homology domain-containing protein [Clostridia bacterium]|nr:S-layer homology domain-containing protein [Clostridia bacterium]
MKTNKYVSLILAVLFALSAFTAAVPAYASAFSDVEAGRWSEEDIAYAVEKGYMNGTGAETFSPDDSMTRAMIVTILWRREGEPRVKYRTDFLDVADGEWYSSAVLWAKNSGVVNGTSETEFSPDSDVTREQLAAILMRYTAYLRYTTALRRDLKNYTDAGEISEYAYDAMSWAVRIGLISGTTATTLSPRGFATREQFAAILRRYDGVKFTYSTKLAKAEAIYPEDGDEISVMNPLAAKFVRRFENGDFDGEADPELVYSWLPSADTRFYRESGINLTWPVSVNFVWKCDDPTRLMVLDISEDEDFSTAASLTKGRITFTPDGTYSCLVTNFKVATKYYWRVRTDFRAVTETRSFTTAPDRFRQIYLDGGNNARDIGGDVNRDGKRIRQGVLYRGGEPEVYSEEDRYCLLTQEGRRILGVDLGVKTRLDLQADSVGVERGIGEWYGVNYVLRPCAEGWTPCLTGEGAEWFREIFEVVLDTDNYPLYFHCYAGADRTGTVGACIDSLLGFSAEDLKLRFDFTSLSLIWQRSWYDGEKDDTGAIIESNRVNFFNQLAEMFPEARDNCEQVEMFLLSIGIEQEKIDAFRDYMILD